jgi:Predicted site-specific integrase-resolvase
MGVRYETAWRWFKQGNVPGQQLPSGTIVVLPPEERQETHQPMSVAIYARVSAAENRPDLERQAERLRAYGSAKGYQITQITQLVTEVGSGVNDRRPRLLRWLADSSIKVIVVEHQDRATGFGFDSLDTLLAAQGRAIEVVNLAEDGHEDLVSDLGK